MRVIQICRVVLVQIVLQTLFANKWALNKKRRLIWMHISKMKYKHKRYLRLNLALFRMNFFFLQSNKLIKRVELDFYVYIWAKNSNEHKNLWSQFAWPIHQKIGSYFYFIKHVQLLYFRDQAVENFHEIGSAQQLKFKSAISFFQSNVI